MTSTCPLCNTEHENLPDACPRRLEARRLDKQGQAPLIGVTVRNRYRITELLGKGAMGVVYKATQLDDGKDVAIKVLHTHLASDPESLKRFQYEAHAAKRLMHPHIVRLYDVGMIPGGQPYLAMEYLEGRMLGDLLREKRYFSTKEALPIIRQTCEALAEAHGHGVLHRDIKPANIMLTNRFGEEQFVVVLDFSISKVIQKVSDVDTTTPGLIFGSPLYMSPERFMGKGGDFRSDIYSIGIIMFQMLAGRAPFKSGDLYTLMNEHVSTVPPRVKDVRPDSDIPEILEETIARALAKKPEDRQANMRQLLADINDVYRETSSLVNPVPVLPMHQGTVLSNTQTLGTPLTNPVFGSDPGAPAIGGNPASGSTSTPPSVFDINPGLTPAVAISAYNPSAHRKSLAEDSSLSKAHDRSLTGQEQRSLAAQERTLTGQFDKSLVVRSDGNRLAIRPPEPSRSIPLEAVALVVVLVLGIGAIIMSFLPSGTVPGAATTGGATHQREMSPHEPSRESTVHEWSRHGRAH